jgi:hypothetical protein
VFSKGSTVALKALPQKNLGVGAPIVSEFSHWSGGAVDGVKESLIRIVVESDMTIVAHFKPIEASMGQ